MATKPLFDFDEFRKQNQFDNFDYSGADSYPTPTFQDSGPMNPTQNTDYPIQTQNSVFNSQSRGKEHPAVSDAYNRIKSLFDSYTPDTTSSTRLNNLLDNMPQINTPSLGRKFVAAGAALGNVDNHFRRQGGGMEEAQKVLYAPYINEMAAFKEKAGPFQAAATAENARNIQERTLLSNMMTAQTAQDKLDESGRQADQKAEITRQRNAILASKDLGYTYTKLGDTLIGHRPDGTTFEAGQASNFNALELETLKQEGRMAVQGSRNQGALDVQGSRNQGNLDVQGSRNQGALDVQGARNEGSANVANIRTGAGAKPMTPAQVTTDRLNQVQAILALAPELAPFIDIQGRVITMHEPTAGWFSSVDPRIKAAFDQARKAVFPVNPLNQTPTGQTIPKVNPGNVGQGPNAPKSDPYKYGKSKSQPNEWTRTLNGKTEYSHDGGKNWGPL